MGSDSVRGAVPLVVVDTTALFPDPMLRSVDSRLLLSAANEGLVRLIVPAVVVAEAVRHYRREIRSQYATVRTALARLDRLAVAPEGTVDTTSLSAEFVKAFNEYRVRLTDAVEDVGGEIAKWPTTSHESLVSRDLAERRPFRASGKGYRDALIWETVLDAIARAPSGSEAILISANASDFCGDKGHLHEHLQDDVLEAIPSQSASPTRVPPQKPSASTPSS